MSTPVPAEKKKFSLSPDVWAVVLSLALALLVRVGILKTVAW